MDAQDARLEKKHLDIRQFLTNPYIMKLSITKIKMEQQSNLRKENITAQEKVKEGKTEDNKTFNKENSNVIFIGDKPLVNYIRGVITLFIKKDFSEVIIKSRGRFISKAVDVAEVSKRSLADKNIKVRSINISSESFETEGKRTNISTMDIVLGK